MKTKRKEMHKTENLDKKKMNKKERKEKKGKINQKRRQRELEANIYDKIDKKGQNQHNKTNDVLLTSRQTCMSK